MSTASSDTLLWKYAAAQDVVFLRLTSLGSLLVSTADGLVALDPASGRPLWTRPDIKSVPAGGFDGLAFTPYGVVRSRNGIAVLDLQTGRTLWDSTGVPLQTIRGYFFVPERRLLLLYGKGRSDGRSLAALDIDSGTVRWEQRTLLDAEPELWESDKVHSLWGHQPPLADTDSTLVLYINKDGPFKIHAGTGQLIWRVATLKGEDPPTLAAVYPHILSIDSMLLVPYGRKLMAVHAGDGRVLWTRAKNFPSALSQMQATSCGLLVRGIRPLDQNAKAISKPDAFVDCVSLETGLSVWQKPFGDMKDQSLAPFRVVGDTVYLGDSDRLFAIALRDGGARVVTTYDFGGGEEPTVIERRNDVLMLISAHNLLLVSTSGAPTVRRHYPAPGTSFLGNLGKAALFAASVMSQANAMEQQHRPGGHVTASFDYNPFIRQRMLGAIQAFEDYTFMYTKEPDRAGRQGFSLVRLRKADGEEVGRAWLNERSPQYELDVVSATVFAKRGNREIVAIQITGP